MIGYVLLSLLLSGLTLLGAAVFWWLSRRPADSGAMQPVSAHVNHGQDLLQETTNGEAENGLAAFYAYQMAAGRIDRHRGST